jgi:hypothetical protein
MDALVIMAIVAVTLVVLFFGLVVFIGAPYVPSQTKYVRRAFEHFGLSSNDTLVDLGSGDGVVLRIASSYGASAVGYEVNPFLIGLSRLYSLHDPRVRIEMRNFWLSPLPDETTIVYAFAVQRDEKKLIKLLQKEADRQGQSLRLICLGSPLKGRPAQDLFEAYALYVFNPLQSKKA